MNEIYRDPAERRKFMESKGLSYLSRSIYKDVSVFLKDQKTSPYYLDNHEEFRTLSSDYKDKIKEAWMADVSIRLVSEDVGYGLFAEADMNPGDILAEYAGVVQPGEDLVLDPDTAERPPEGFETDYTWDYPDAWYEDLLFEVNAGKMGNELRYINHSFEANLAVEHTLIDNRWVIFFVAQQFIRAGTQFTVDYGEEYWSGGFRELILF
ncbi:MULTISPECIES: SET domain-containing protein-lysine N-methyltransferase [unclassified Oceanispirochaeta]|uniref:SET domain-containing protein-lysine N-methyltransferase n=1 Tax=unclassified Oceanispirochaeta TaxID=2635722 RepID=UPI000E090C56|nr:MULTISPECIES: SET domain-containing protein-lysine N-methyltransferase [unclassified Oceanispirochaeta]MBF9015895.1 SET domain-containing protein-lysine N-methyltransferase [Oceanispirochaeta sp. M2]NPD72358.1 SET domain-containing protein [Oceanispirochaeta sp. M1]RDG32129.1 SET domain-containing protein [Oceanispirochaeta sp. M1]